MHVSLVNFRGSTFLKTTALTMPLKKSFAKYINGKCDIALLIFAFKDVQAGLVPCPESQS